MSHDNFDSELSKLYQKRKAEIIAPKVTFDKPVKRSKLSPFSILAIFSSAGIASFGIIAVISHFATTPIETATSNNKQHNIITKTIINVEEESDHSVEVAEQLPPMPPSKKASAEPMLLADQQVIINNVEPNHLVKTKIQRVTLPQIQRPELAVQPTHKVLPTYSVNSLKSRQAGEVLLKYQIMPDGSVSDIRVLKSTVNRTLQQSAKKALAKWRYTPSDTYKENYEIIFAFTLSEN